MNTYHKFAPNVFVAKCTEEHLKGDVITLTTNRGNKHECIVFNSVGSRAGFFYYSIVRADGFDRKAWAERRAERLRGFAANAEKRSDAYYSKSKKDSDFLSLGEPIKVGHHSEGRHRKIIEQAQNNARRCYEESDKATKLEDRAKHWEKEAEKITAADPTCLEIFEEQFELARMHHTALKSGKIEPAHNYSTTYARNKVRDAEKKLQLARLLWGEV